MKLISWNVNGLRACKTHGFIDSFNGLNADIFAIQETKMQEGQDDVNISGYYSYMSSAVKKGYSGTLVYTKEKPLNVIYGINEKYNDEGRVITLEYSNFYFVNAYVPNAQEELKRIDFRLEYEKDIREYLSSLAKTKSVIYCGDLNVAHNPIDIKNAKANEGQAGYSIPERESFSKLLDCGFIDTYRYLYPENIKYSWWSYRFKARERNAGWRIDYFITSKDLESKLVSAEIHNEIYGSDHCPVELIINL